MRHVINRIRFGDSEIVYRITRTDRRRTIAVTVAPDSGVFVTAPKGTRRAQIAATVSRKAKWILRQRDWFTRNANALPRRLVSGESLYYLGRQCQLKVFLLAGKYAIPKVALTRGSFVVMVPRRWSHARRHKEIRSVLVDWYRYRAATYLAPIVQRFADRLAVQYVGIQIRDMRTRWGSGGTSGRFLFNWRIVMASRRLVEYVVAHELCHVAYPDHSQSFWRLLAKVMPDYERRRIELEISGPKYDLPTRSSRQIGEQITH